MKTKVENVESCQFKPIQVTLTFETLQEARAFYSIWNYTVLAKVIEEASGLPYGTMFGAVCEKMSALHPELYDSSFHSDFVCDIEIAIGGE